MPVLNLRLNSTENKVNLTGHIQAQDMVLRTAVVQFTDTAHGVMAVNCDIPFLTRFQIHNSQAGNRHLTVPVIQGQKSTIVHQDLHFYAESVPQSFVVDLFKEDGETALPASFSELQLFFDYKITTLF